MGFSFLTGTLPSAIDDQELLFHEQAVDDDCFRIGIREKTIMGKECE
jgi:hypothetical protein